MLLNLKKNFFLSKLALLMSLFLLNNCSSKVIAENNKSLNHQNIELIKTFNLELIRFQRDEVSIFIKKFREKNNIQNFKTISSNMSSKNFVFDSGIGLLNIEEYIIEIFQSFDSLKVENLRIDMSSSKIIIERLI